MYSIRQAYFVVVAIAVLSQPTWAQIETANGAINSPIVKVSYAQVEAADADVRVVWSNH